METTLGRSGASLKPAGSAIGQADALLFDLQTVDNPLHQFITTLPVTAAQHARKPPDTPKCHPHTAEQAIGVSAQFPSSSRYICDCGKSLA